MFRTWNKVVRLFTLHISVLSSILYAPIVLRENGINDAAQFDHYICESVALIHSPESIPESTPESTKLLCGLRNGTLVTFDVTSPSGAFMRH